MNRGIALLRQAIAEHGNNESEVARVLGVDQSHVNRVAAGKKPAGLDFRRKAKEHLGISLDDWEEELPPDTERANH